MMRKQPVAANHSVKRASFRHDLSLLLCCVFPTLSGCTRGHLDYATPQGEHKTGCHTEYRWAPAVDKHSVEYVLAYCAKGAVAQGHRVQDPRLLQLDLKIPAPAVGQRWSHDFAAAAHKAGQLTDQQYGYIVAYLDLGLEPRQATSQEP